MQWPLNLKSSKIGIPLSFKMIMWLILSSLLCPSCFGINDNLTQLDERRWEQEFELDKDFYLKVSPDQNDPDWVVMEMSAPAHGYVAIGFSPNGLMPGSDVVAGWYDSVDRKAYVLDLYTTGYVRPSTDPDQNYELLGGMETETATTIRFRRKWQTFDSNDKEIRPDSKLNVIWTFHADKDPTDFLIDPTYRFGNTPIQLKLSREEKCPLVSPAWIKFPAPPPENEICTRVSEEAFIKKVDIFVVLRVIYRGSISLLQKVMEYVWNIYALFV